MNSLFSSGMSGVAISQIISLFMNIIPQLLVIVGAFIWFRKTKFNWGIALIFSAVMTTLLSIGSTVLTLGYMYSSSNMNMEVIGIFRVILSTAHFFNGLLFGTALLMMAVRTVKKSDNIQI